MKEEDQIEELSRELESIKNNNKEILLYLSVLGKMMIAGNSSLFRKMEKKEDRDIAKVLIDYQDREEFSQIKENEIKTGTVSQEYLN